MGKMLLGLVAIAASGLAAPASADPGFASQGAPPPTVFSGGGNGGNHHGGRHNGGLGIWVNGGEWARYNNQTFASDSFNDWWHDRPDRAYPAWMRNNQDCAKLWYSGGTLRC